MIETPQERVSRWLKNPLVDLADTEIREAIRAVLAEVVRLRKIAKAFSEMTWERDSIAAEVCPRVDESVLAAVKRVVYAELQARNRAEKIEAVLRTLLDKLERVEASEAYRSVWIVAQIHSGPYHGENWAVERNAARAALRDTVPVTDYERFRDSSPENAVLLDAERRVLEAEERAAVAEAALRRIAEQRLGEETWDELMACATGCIDEARTTLRDTTPEERHWQDDADPNPGRAQAAYQAQRERRKP